MKNPIAKISGYVMRRYRTSKEKMVSRNADLDVKYVTTKDNSVCISIGGVPVFIVNGQTDVGMGTMSVDDAKAFMSRVKKWYSVQENGGI